MDIFHLYKNSEKVFILLFSPRGNGLYEEKCLSFCFLPGERALRGKVFILLFSPWGNGRMLRLNSVTREQTPTYYTWIDTQPICQCHGFSLKWKKTRKNCLLWWFFFEIFFCERMLRFIIYLFNIYLPRVGQYVRCLTFSFCNEQLHNYPSPWVCL